MAPFKGTQLQDVGCGLQIQAVSAIHEYINGVGVRCGHCGPLGPVHAQYPLHL